MSQQEDRATEQVERDTSQSKTWLVLPPDLSLVDALWLFFVVWTTTSSVLLLPSNDEALLDIDTPVSSSWRDKVLVPLAIVILVVREILGTSNDNDNNNTAAARSSSSSSLLNAADQNHKSMIWRGIDGGQPSGRIMVCAVFPTMIFAISNACTQVDPSFPNTIWVLLSLICLWRVGLVDTTRRSPPLLPWILVGPLVACLVPRFDTLLVLQPMDDALMISFRTSTIHPLALLASSSLLYLFVFVQLFECLPRRPMLQGVFTCGEWTLVVGCMTVWITQYGWTSLFMPLLGLRRMNATGNHNSTSSPLVYVVARSGVLGSVLVCPWIHWMWPVRRNTTTHNHKNGAATRSNLDDDDDKTRQNSHHDSSQDRNAKCTVASPAIDHQPPPQNGTFHPTVDHTQTNWSQPTGMQGPSHSSWNWMLPVGVAAVCIMAWVELHMQLLVWNVDDNTDDPPEDTLGSWWSEWPVPPLCLKWLVQFLGHVETTGGLPSSSEQSHQTLWFRWATWPRWCWVVYWCLALVITLVVIPLLWDSLMVRAWRKQQAQVEPKHETTINNASTTNGSNHKDNEDEKHKKSSRSLSPSSIVTLKRKWFHAVAVLVFGPVTIFAPQLQALGYAVALAILILIEGLQVRRQVPWLQAFYQAFLDPRKHETTTTRANHMGDDDKVIVSHLSLIAGCAMPLFVALFLLEEMNQENSRNHLLGTERQEQLLCLSLVGIVGLGVGDAVAAVAGTLYSWWKQDKTSLYAWERFLGLHHWGRWNRTWMGSIAMFLSMYAFVYGLEYARPWFVQSSPWYNNVMLSDSQQTDQMVDSSTSSSWVMWWTPCLVWMTIVEAYTSQLDNLVLPLVGMTVFVLSFRY